MLTAATCNKNFGFGIGFKKRLCASANISPVKKITDFIVRQNIVTTRRCQPKTDKESHLQDSNGKLCVDCKNVIIDDNDERNHRFKCSLYIHHIDTVSGKVEYADASSMREPLLTNMCGPYGMLL
jgi:hypothetical protein